MATGHGAPSDAIRARETHKQRESGQSGSKDDEWEQVNDAKQRCRLVLSSSLATPRSQLPPLGECRQNSRSQRRRGKFALADRSQLLDPKLTALTQATTKNGRVAPKMIFADQTQRQQTESLPVHSVSRPPLWDGCRECSA